MDREPDDVVVVIRDATGAPAGLGVLVDQVRVLTCAHVVEQALGRGAPARGRTASASRRHVLEDAAGPGVGPGGGDGREHRVRVEILRRDQDGDHSLLDVVAPTSDWNPTEDGDLALLTLPVPVPVGVVPARLVGPGVAVAQWPPVLRVFGYPQGRPRGQWTQVRAIGVVDGGRVQLTPVDSALSSVRAGDSGSPVHDPHTGEVVALVTESPTGGSSQASLSIPASAIRAFLQASVGGMPARRSDAVGRRPARGPGDAEASRRRPDRAYAPADELTVLHLSDLQFGSVHGFGGEGLTAGDRRRDPLTARLHADLGKLSDAHGLWPDLVVVTGDLTFHANPSEFERVGDFLAALMDAVGLSRRRLAMIPGNHDISWAASQAYFASETSLERQAVPPYAPKWRNYQKMFQKFYAEGPVDPRADPPLFVSEQRPWTLFEMPDLKVVVAGLNSTIADSHLDSDHYGWVGEDQLAWFAERLRGHNDAGWLVLGAVHHSPQSGTLRDADDLDRILGHGSANVEIPYRDRADDAQAATVAGPLHLMLHGHSHARSKSAGRLPSGLAALSVGDALSAGRNPDQISPRYQLITLRHDGMIRHLRLYVPDRKIWVGDTRADRFRDSWGVATALPLSAPAALTAPEAAPLAGPLLRDSSLGAPWGLDLARVRRVQRDRLAVDRECPRTRYVSHRFRQQYPVTSSAQDGRPLIEEGAVDRVLTWLAEPGARFVTILGGFGSGKTTLMRELVRRIPERIEAQEPVLLDLRTAEEGQSLYDLVGQSLLRLGAGNVTTTKVQYLMSTGRLAVLLDGFDEVMRAAPHRTAGTYLRSLLAGATDEAKIVLTGRAQDFHADSQLLRVLLEQPRGQDVTRILELEGFSDAQIEDLVLGLYDGDRAQAEHLLQRLSQAWDLQGLARNPRSLRSLASIWALSHDRLDNGEQSEGALSPADLYREYFHQLAERDAARQGTWRVLPTLGPEERLAVSRELALRLWAAGDVAGVVTSEDLAETTAAVLGDLERLNLTAEQACYAIGSGSLLTQTQGGFGFTHRSFLEWLVADAVTRDLMDGLEPQPLAQAEMSDGMTSFLCDLAGHDRALEWARLVQLGPTSALGEDRVRRANALRIMARLHRSTVAVPVVAERFNVADGLGRPVGREDVLHRLRNRLQVRAPAALLGPRRAGKSWVLEELTRRLQDDRVTSVRRLTLPAEGSGVTSPDDLAVLLDGSVAGRRSPSTALLERAERCMRTPSPLIFLLDEIGRLTRYGPAAVSWLRDLGQAGAGMVYVGTLKDWHTTVRWALTAPGSSFGNDVARFELGPLEQTVAKRFIVGTAANLGVTLAEDMREAIIDLVGTWPFYLQVVGDAIVRATGGERQPPLGRTALDRLVQDCLIDGWAPVFAGRWAEIGPAGQAALLSGQCPPPERLAPAQRNDLRDVGLLGPGDEWLPDPPFYRWVIRNASSLRDRTGER